MDKKDFADKIQKLPKEIQIQLAELLDTLSSEEELYYDYELFKILMRFKNSFIKYKRVLRKRRKNKFTFKWEGGLSELKGQFTSVELQHKALEWR